MSDTPDKGMDPITPEVFERLRSMIMRSVASELRTRGGDRIAYGYTKSSNDNYGKYEKE